MPTHVRTKRQSQILRPTQTKCLLTLATTRAAPKALSSLAPPLYAIPSPTIFQVSRHTDTDSSVTPLAASPRRPVALSAPLAAASVTPSTTPLAPRLSATVSRASLAASKMLATPLARVLRTLARERRAGKGREVLGRMLLVSRCM